MKDSFGIEIEPGDYVLSASTSGARVKLGRIVQGRNGFLMAIDHSAAYGSVETHPRSGQLGYNVVILSKADGSIPAHITPAEAPV